MSNKKDIVNLVNLNKISAKFKDLDISEFCANNGVELHIYDENYGIVNEKTNGILECLFTLRREQTGITVSNLYEAFKGSFEFVTVAMNEQESLNDIKIEFIDYLRDLEKQFGIKVKSDKDFVDLIVKAARFVYDNMDIACKSDKIFECRSFSDLLLFSLLKREYIRIDGNGRINHLSAVRDYTEVDMPYMNVNFNLYLGDEDVLHVFLEYAKPILDSCWKQAKHVFDFSPLDMKVSLDNLLNAKAVESAVVPAVKDMHSVFEYLSEYELEDLIANGIYFEDILRSLYTFFKEASATASLNLDVYQKACKAVYDHLHSCLLEMSSCNPAVLRPYVANLMKDIYSAIIPSNRRYQLMRGLDGILADIAEYPSKNDVNIDREFLDSLFVNQDCYSLDSNSFNIYKECWHPIEVKQCLEKVCFEDVGNKYDLHDLIVRKLREVEFLKDRPGYINMFAHFISNNSLFSGKVDKYNDYFVRLFSKFNVQERAGYFKFNSFIKPDFVDPMDFIRKKEESKGLTAKEKDMLLRETYTGYPDKMPRNIDPMFLDSFTEAKPSKRKKSTKSSKAPKEEKPLRAPRTSKCTKKVTSTRTKTKTLI